MLCSIPAVNDQKLSFTFANIWLDDLDKEFVKADVAAVANDLADCPCLEIRAVVGPLPMSVPLGKASRDYRAILDCDCGNIRKTFVRPIRIV